MTAKEKAKELLDKYLDINDDYLGDNGCGITEYQAKQGALIAVEFAREFITGDLSERFDKFIYLQDVKEEIEKL